MAWTMKTHLQQHQPTEQFAGLFAARVTEEHKKHLLHEQQGHLKYDPECEHRVKAGGRCRRHSRSKSPSTNTLYVDVAGPFILAHGHDSALKKHMVVFALRTSQGARTIPSGNEETTEQEEKEDVMGCTHQCERLVRSMMILFSVGRFVIRLMGTLGFTHVQHTKNEKMTMTNRTLHTNSAMFFVLVFQRLVEKNVLLRRSLKRWCLL
jgi:hypothetical protein